MAIEGIPVLCIFCADQALLKKDRRGRPYLDCPHCLARCFLHGRSEIGLRLTQELLAPHAEAHREVLRRRINEAVIQNEMERLAAQQAPTRRGPSKKR